jgi:hypothetical protein
MSGSYGPDVSTPLSVKQWQSLISGRSATFGVVRCYQSDGKVDPNAPATVLNGWAAGLASVDVYHFPDCTTDAATQVQGAVSALRQAGARFGRYWLDVELSKSSEGTYDNPSKWSTTDPQANAAFLSDLIAAADSLGLSVGIYTSACSWSLCMGDSSSFAEYPLWYAQYETPAQASFDDFKPFGGWTAPTMKQFAGDESYEGICYDGNWTPTCPSLAPATSVRDTVVQYAQSLAGLSAAQSTYLRYVGIVAAGENLTTQASMAHMSGCGLTVAGIWRGSGYRGAALDAPYKVETAISRLIQIGQSAGGYVAYQSGALPSPGDMVYIGESPNEHVYTVISVDKQGESVVIQSIDGGYPGSAGSDNSIASSQHVWTNGRDSDLYKKNRTINGWIVVTRVITSPARLLPGFVQAAPPGRKGLDVSAPISTEAAAAIAAAGYTFVIRYVSTEGAGLTATEAEIILAAGLGLMLVQQVDAAQLTFSSAVGGQHGQAAAASAATLGLPMCVNVWLVLDRIPAGTSAAALTAYYKAWSSAVSDAGLLPGLCVTAGEVLDGAALGGLAFSHYWQAAGAVVTPSPRGYLLVQGSGVTVSGVTATEDVTQNDNGHPPAAPNQAEWLVLQPA